MKVFTHEPARSRMLRGLGHNPLLRRSDRIEAVVAIIAVGLALLAIPMAAAIGGAVHGGYARVYAEQLHTRYPVTATVAEGSAPTARPYIVANTIQANWTADGVQHSGKVRWDGPTKAGDHIDLWVDGSGNQVSPPTAPWSAAVESFAISVAIWLAVVAAAAAGVALVRQWLNRGRQADWEREIRTLLDHGSGRSNSRW
jgi:hypothetical protein